MPIYYIFDNIMFYMEIYLYFVTLKTGQNYVSSVHIFYPLLLIHQSDECYLLSNKLRDLQS